MLRLMRGYRIPAGPLGTALGEGRDPLLRFCHTCGLVAGGALHLLCLVRLLGGHPRPSRAVMEGTQDTLAGPSKTQKLSPLATDEKLRPRAVP